MYQTKHNAQSDTYKLCYDYLTTKAVWKNERLIFIFF